MKCIFSVDVEDWFHILDVPSAPPLSEWDRLPSRVERNFLRLLDIFGEADVRVTCFFLGWVAERFPHLVREADRRGHEIASHGYAHRLVYEMTRDEFYDDAVKSKGIIEDALGREILGYRASGFSVTAETPWFFETLTEAGYRYDSSVFPARRSHGGLRRANQAPYCLNAEGLIEFPVTVIRICHWPLCFFGGGYLRLYPLSLIEKMTSKVLKEDRPVVFYVHPREIDPHHPRLPMSLYRRFKSYVNLSETELKIKRLCRDFEVTTFESFIAGNPAEFKLSGRAAAAAAGGWGVEPA